MRDRTAYHPDGLQTWDVWYAANGPTVHAYYLQKPAPDTDASILRADWIGHATTADLVTWEEQPRALGPDTSSDIDDLQPWTGSALWHDGTAHLFFTMRGSRRPTARVQRIGLATSTDGERWERHPGNPVLEADPATYESDPDGVVDCRDLLVIPDPGSDGWIGFYAARLKGVSLSAGAAIASAYSADLVHWEHRGPVFAPGSYACLEVPDVFQIDGRWYLTCLVGNRYGNRLDLEGSRLTNGTVYAVADTPFGPYREHPGDRALLAGDVTSGYSCRSVEHDGRRYLLYTEPTASGRDSISPPLLLRATPEGALRLHWTALTEKLRSRRLPVAGELRQLGPTPHWPQHNGLWEAAGPGVALRGSADGGWHVAADETALRGGARDADAFEIVASFTADGEPAFGFAVGPSGDISASGSLVVGIDVRRGVAIGATLPDFVDAIERPLPGALGPSTALRLVVRGERIQLYIDDILWLQFSRPWTVGGRAGLGWFVENGSVVASDIDAWVLGDS